MGNIIAGQNVTFIVNGVVIGNATSDNDGIASINYTPTNIGFVSVTGSSYNGAYPIIVKTGTLHVKSNKNVNSTINVSGNLKVGETITVSGVLTDEDGNPIANATISITIDNKKFTAKTNNVGAWTLQFIPKNTGNTNVLVNWTGDDIYFGFTNSTSLNIAKGKTNAKITISNNVKVGNTITIKTTLTDANGKPIIRAKIDFYKNGTKIGSALTNSNGLATLKYRFAQAGNYNITAKYNGNNTYTPTSTSSTTKATYKNNPNVKIEVDGDKITATVTDNDGNPIKGKKIYFRIKGHIIGFGITDANGQVSIYYEDANKYKITVSFEGDEKFNTASGKVAMKKTGVPVIAILLALLISFGLLRYKKRY
jgi:protocatechuate 3,4-dioxygenase beta subunit